MTPRFLDSPTLQHLRQKDGRPLWRLSCRLRYNSAILNARVTIPAGFETDLASVPRLPFVWWFAGGRATRAAIVHDYLYVIRRPDRRTADRVFLEAMEAENDPPSAVKRWAMYQAVVWFGKSAWNKNRDVCRRSLLASRPAVFGRPLDMPVDIPPQS